MKTIQIKDEIFLQNIENTINRLIDFNFLDNELDGLCEIFRNKTLTKENTSFLYTLITHFENNFEDEEIEIELAYIKSILKKHFIYELTIEDETTYLTVSYKNEG